MSANKFALMRYKIIDKNIKNKYKPYPTKQDLRVACEEALYGSYEGEHISESTIEKDMWAMRNESQLGYFAPIEYSRNHKGYYYSDDNFSIESIPLSDQEMESIALAAHTLNNYKDMAVFKEFGAAIDKILNRVKIGNLNDETPEKKFLIQFENAPKIEGEHFIKILFDAIEHRNKVVLEYQKFGSKNIKQYDYSPYLLKEYKNRWYVLGKNEERDIIQTFALDRVKKVKISQEKYARVDFDPEAYFKYCIGITSSKDLPQKIDLKFDAAHQHYIESQPLHSSQQIVEKSDSGIHVRLEAYLTYELISMVLSFGSGVEVIEPKALKLQIQEELERGLLKYKS